MRAQRLVLACVVLISLAACDPGPQAEVFGFVSQLDEGTLPESAIITVELQETSLADAQTKVLATDVIEDSNQPPGPFFALSYDPDDIDEGNTYTLEAKIEDDGQLLYTTETPHTVDFDDLLNEDGVQVNIVVVPVGS